MALFVRQGLTIAALGGIIDFFATAGLSRWVTSLLCGVSPLDPFTFIAAALTIVSAAASYLPARQAASVDPMDNLRSD